MRTCSRSVIHVSKFPPSPSGVALYASQFSEVLARHGDVTCLPAPPLPSDSQSFRSALRGFWLGVRTHPAGSDVVHVELSGRALFELYYAIGLAARGGGRHLVLACHDAPSVAGAPLLFRCFDRRGFRRMAMRVSNAYGFSIAAYLLKRAGAVMALTQQGAASLEARYQRPVAHLPILMLPVPTVPRKRRRVFIPGYVDDVPSIISVIAAVASDEFSDWTVHVGASSDVTTSEVARRLSTKARRRVVFTGFLPESELLAEFAEAAVVVHLRPKVPGANQYAASGPLAVALGHGCVCLSTDPRPGVKDLAVLGVVELTDHVEKSLPPLLRNYEWSGQAGMVMQRAAAVAGPDVVSSLYGELLQCASMEDEN